MQRRKLTLSRHTCGSCVFTDFTGAAETTSLDLTDCRGSLVIDQWSSVEVSWWYDGILLMGLLTRVSSVLHWAEFAALVTQFDWTCLLCEDLTFQSAAWYCFRPSLGYCHNVVTPPALYQLHAGWPLNSCHALFSRREKPDCQLFVCPCYLDLTLCLHPLHHLPVLNAAGQSEQRFLKAV